MNDAAVGAGATGVRIETWWCWQPAVRFYLQLGFWVQHWKRSLVFTRSTSLRPYRVVIEGTRARFSALMAGAWTPLIDADNRGLSLGWTERETFSSPDGVCSHLRYRAAGTFALHLAVAGWPPIRSAELWARRDDWSDMGMPEGLARKIPLFEAADRRRGYDVRTPRIPGLAYDTMSWTCVRPAVHRAPAGRGPA